MTISFYCGFKFKQEKLIEMDANIAKVYNTDAKSLKLGRRIVWINRLTGEFGLDND